MTSPLRHALCQNTEIRTAAAVEAMGNGLLGRAVTAGVHKTSEGAPDSKEKRVGDEVTKEESWVGHTEEKAAEVTTVEDLPELKSKLNVRLVTESGPPGTLSAAGLTIIPNTTLEPVTDPTARRALPSTQWHTVPTTIPQLMVPFSTINARNTHPESPPSSSRSVYYDIQLMYHQLWRTLQRGSARRPALPPSIIALVVRLAGLKTLSRKLTAHSVMMMVVQSQGPLAAPPWFATCALADEDIRRVAAVQLVTYSRCQGWADDPDSASYSWFDVGAFPAPAGNEGESECESEDEGTRKRKYEDKVRAWVTETEGMEGMENRWHLSHRNPITGRRVGKREGGEFDQSHMLWEQMKAGDMIAVRACAQYMKWKNIAIWGQLKVWTWFTPVVDSDSDCDNFGVTANFSLH